MFTIPSCYDQKNPKIGSFQVIIFTDLPIINQGWQKTVLCPEEVMGGRGPVLLTLPCPKCVCIWFYLIYNYIYIIFFFKYILFNNLFFVHFLFSFPKTLVYSLFILSRLPLFFVFHLYLINIEAISLTMEEYLQPALTLTCPALVLKRERGGNGAPLIGSCPVAIPLLSGYL